MTGLWLLLLLGAWAGVRAAAPAAPQVKRSTSAAEAGAVKSTSTKAGLPPLAPEPENIPELKRRIKLDQDEVLKTRGAVKRAKVRKDAAAEAKAREAWLKAKEQLKADRELLKQANNAAEEEQGEREKVRQELRKRESLKP